MIYRRDIGGFRELIGAENTDVVVNVRERRRENAVPNRQLSDKADKTAIKKQSKTINIKVTNN